MDSVARDLSAWLKTGTELPVRRVFYGESSPLPSYKVQNTSNIRLIMPLTGKKHIAFASGNRAVEMELAPGDVLLTRPFGWTAEFWDSEHSMISVSFKEETMRIIYIAHDGMAAPPLQPDAVFYTDHPQSRWGGAEFDGPAFRTAGKSGRSFSDARSALQHPAGFGKRGRHPVEG